MSDAREYGREVNEFINQFCAVEEHKNGKWIAYLDPLHDFVRNGKQPPGQINFYQHGDPTYSAGNIYWDGLPPSFERAGSTKWELRWSIDLSVSENRERWKAAWAGRPCFNTMWSARKTIEDWVRQNRIDIVREAENHAREALAYRRRKANSDE